MKYTLLSQDAPDITILTDESNEITRVAPLLMYTNEVGEWREELIGRPMDGVIEDCRKNILPWTSILNSGGSNILKPQKRIYKPIWEETIHEPSFVDRHIGGLVFLGIMAFCILMMAIHYALFPPDPADVSRRQAERRAEERQRAYERQTERIVSDWLETYH